MKQGGVQPIPSGSRSRGGVRRPQRRLAPPDQAEAPNAGLPRLLRGMLRPPSNARLSRHCGSAGRTGALPPEPRTDVLLAERRTVVVPARIALEERAS